MTDKLELDFSQFHPLDHHPWEKRCRKFYGGWQRHLYLEWTYRTGPELGYRIRQPVYFVLCQLDHHDWLTHSTGRGEYWTKCAHCQAERETGEDEKFSSPSWIIPDE